MTKTQRWICEFITGIFKSLFGVSFLGFHSAFPEFILFATDFRLSHLSLEPFARRRELLKVNWLFFATSIPSDFMNFWVYPPKRPPSMLGYGSSAQFPEFDKLETAFSPGSTVSEGWS